MSEIEQFKTKCRLCKRKSYQWVAVSGYDSDFDLDFRSDGLQLETTVQCCTHCGYCAEDLTQTAPPQAQDVVASARYQEQLRSHQFPELANHFLCKAQIQEAEGSAVDAAWSMLSAAWACDDAQAVAASQQCRRLALARFEEAYTLGLPISRHDRAGAHEALVADLLRRCGEFQRATDVCDAGLTRQPASLFREILLLERRLASQQDSQIHRLSEIPGWKDLDPGQEQEPQQAAPVAPPWQASPGSRLAAFALDGALGLCLAMALNRLLGSAVAEWLFFIGWISLRDCLPGSRSPGKALCGLQVLDFESRLPASRTQAMVRNLPMTAIFTLMALAVASQIVSETVYRATCAVAFLAGAWVGLYLLEDLAASVLLFRSTRDRKAGTEVVLTQGLESKAAAASPKSD